MAGAAAFRARGLSLSLSHKKGCQNDQLFLCVREGLSIVFSGRGTADTKTELAIGGVRKTCNKSRLNSFRWAEKFSAWSRF